MTNIIEQIAQTTYKINCIKELPEILVSEFLRQQIVGSIFCFSCSVFIALICLAALRKEYEEGGENDKVVYWIFLILLLAALGAFYNLNQLFQIFFTPNLYLIENIKDLVAK
jgi:hypothetical protein